MRYPVAALWVVVAACGGSPTAPPSSTPSGTTITITAAGIVEPKELVVSPGTRVLFLNRHSRRHDMTSDQHPDHQDCPPLNNVGVLNPGQQRETGNLVDVRTCGFHDHEDDRNEALKGTIVVR